MKTIQQKIRDLASLDIAQYVKRFGVSEENVKFHIVVPLLELLEYTANDMSFEHPVLNNKRADIALIFDGKAKLIVEVKRLGENLDDHVDQVMDYALGKGVDWVLLTNGTEMRVYKSYLTGIDKKDRILPPSPVRLTDLPLSFPALHELVGKQALQTEQKLREVAEAKRENITAKILIDDLSECRKRLFSDLLGQFKARYEKDTKFKETIDSWASSVKMNISDPALIEKLCREGAYTLINRVLFLRICEDKRHIKAKLSKDAVGKLRQMVENPANLLDMAFKDIRQLGFIGLYKSPLFDAIDFEDIEWDRNTIDYILDRLGNHDFSTISKDILGKAYEQHISREERKQLGQFYTPDFVIDYILDQVGVTPAKKILDPACGSGGFLMKAYDRLRKQYLEQGWAEEVIHQHMLKNNLYGIDINPFATQLTVMNLLLEDLDHPTGEMNVVEGDSLDKTYDGLDMDILETQTPLARVTSVDKQVSLVRLLRNRPFDIVVSNPPYITVWGIDNKTKRYLQKNYQCATGRFNTFTVFLERAMELIEVGGRLGFVVPDGLLTNIEYQPIREYILAHSRLLKITTMPKDTFAASVDTIVIILQKENNEVKRRGNQVEVTITRDSASIPQAQAYNINQDLFTSNEYRMFLIFLTPELQPIYEKVHSQTVPLKKLVEIQQGIIYSGLPKRDVFANSKLSKDYVRILDGRDIARYRNNYSFKAENRYLKYGKHLHRPREDRLFLAPEKLLLQRKSTKVVATYDDEQFFALNTLYILVPKQTKDEVSLKYLLALLNSSLMNWVYSKTWVGWQVTIPALDILPVKVADADAQQSLEGLVEKMLRLNKQLNVPEIADDQRKAIKKEIMLVDNEIDGQVYDLYGLTEDEKQIIEASFVS